MKTAELKRRLGKAYKEIYVCALAIVAALTVLGINEIFSEKNCTDYRVVKEKAGEFQGRVRAKLSSTGTYYKYIFEDNSVYETPETFRVGEKVCMEYSKWGIDVLR